MPYKEKEIVKKYYSIGEVANLLDVKTSLIRFWESEFDFLSPKKNKSGNRQFVQKDIENLKIIYHLVKERGFTLQGAKDMLKHDVEEVKFRMKMIDRLRNVKKFLVELQSQMD